MPRRSTAIVGSTSGSCRWALLLIVLMATGCAHSRVTRNVSPLALDGTVTIELTHAQAAFASMLMLEQPSARMVVREGAGGRRVVMENVVWTERVERIFEEAGSELQESPEGWTDLVCVTQEVGFDSIESETYQLIALRPPFHWSYTADDGRSFEEFPILDLVRCELSSEGSLDYDLESNTITVFDRADRLQVIERLIEDEESDVE